MISLKLGETRKHISSSNGKTYTNQTLFVNGCDKMSATKKDGSPNPMGSRGALSGRVGVKYLEATIKDIIKDAKAAGVEFIDVVVAPPQESQELRNELSKANAELKAMKERIAKLEAPADTKETEAALEG